MPKEWVLEIVEREWKYKPLVYIFIRVQQFPMLTSLVCGIIIPIQFIGSLMYYVCHPLHNLIGDLQLKLCKFKKLGNNHVLNFNSKWR